ncbi:MAG: PBP1A family penicillin-binding protein [Candidatus Caenarcaniphilales bacterium]|nr:PBP1A family penicillin-binding protein [Candidatus Caenarcaniphilales bacterium]
MNIKSPWNFDQEPSQPDKYGSTKYDGYRAAPAPAPIQSSGTSFNTNFGSGNPKGGTGNGFNFSPQNLSEKLKQFIKNKYARYFLIGLGYMFVAWILLHLLIVPINRILGLPNVSNLQNYSPISSIEVYDKDDQFVTVLQGEEDRQVVPLDQVSTSLKQALFASEDREFYQHGGINVFGILRAMVVNVFSGKIKQGGSTLTQQLVKNIFFPPKEWGTIGRKVKELFLSIEVEQKYSKDQILEFYLNQVYWGKGSYGIERAAKRYFNKSASELNVAESAYLVALLPSPSTLHKSKEAKIRQKNIIENMVKYGYITKTQARDAAKTPLKFESAPGNLSKFPYYMSVVLDELRSRYSDQELRHMGLRVYTSIDTEAQTKAEEALGAGIKKAPKGINQGALVTLDVASNEARVIVGGVGDFWEHQWNRATSVHTIGSAFKPVVYLTSFIKGLYSSNSNIMDTPYVYENSETGEVWTPKNFDNKFWGPITIRKALVNSRNIPAIRVAQKSTIESVQETAQKLGLKGVEPYLSSALGSSAISPLDAANAYAVFARGGIYMKPIVIRRIVDRKGKILEQFNPMPERVLPSGPIYELIDILVDVVDHGTGTGAKIPGLQIAGKTGTADGSRDVWFIGFTPDTVTAVWGGNELNKEASHYATGGVVMAAIWREFMKSYYTINPTPVTTFPKPGKRIRLLIDPITGLLATKDSFQPEYREFVPGTEPKKYAPPPSPEQIEKYLEEMEAQNKYYQDEELDELEDLDNIEEQLVNNPNNYDYGPRYPRGQGPNGATNNPPAPVDINNPDQIPPPTRVKPVLINKEKVDELYPAPQQQNQTPQANEEPRRKKRLFDRFRNKEDNEEAGPQNNPNPAPTQNTQETPRWKRIFNSPY